jgi:hypothetical protein
MHMTQPTETCKRIRDHRTVLSARLDALRFQTFIARCQLAKAHDDAERELLAGRLDLSDARAADIAARLNSMGAP